MKQLFKHCFRLLVCLMTLFTITAMLFACYQRNSTGEMTSSAEVPSETTNNPTTMYVDTKEDTMPDTTINESVAETEPYEDPALNVFPEADKNIEIGIFWEPPAEFTTPEQYDWIRDANITFIEITNHRGGNNAENVALQIKLAEERGIDISYNVGYDGKNLLNMTEAQIIEYVSSLVENPTITGIHVVDEPATPWSYSAACSAITKGGLMPRLNFLPYWATWVFENYNGHVEDTIIAAGKDYYGYLSYDQYPFPYNGGDPDMFYNLNLFREIGLKYDVPTAFYIQSIGEGGNFRRTNGNEIRYHTSAGLAYGLKSMTYFTWWTTGFCDPKDYAIISPYGENTDIYDYVAAVKAQILKVGAVLSRLDALEVYHTIGREKGITPCNADDVPIYAKGSAKYGYIISLMQDRETGRDYVFIVNKNYRKEVTNTFTVSESITHLYNLNNGVYEEMDLSSGKVEITLQPGGFMLLAVGQHDNIVDVSYDKGANLAEGKAVAVESLNPGSGYYAYTITDGIRDNSDLHALGYRSAKDTGWVEVDLGRVTSVNRVDIYPTGTRFARGQNFPQDFTIEVSNDGETWIKVVEKTGYADATQAVPSFTFETAEARYVRMNITQGGAKGGFEIAEMEIYKDDGNIPAPDNKGLYAVVGNEPAGTNVALEREVTASSYVGGWEPAGVTDGSASTGGWTSGLNRHSTENGEEWIMVDLAAEYSIDKVVLYGRSGDEYFPKKYRVEVSTDGSNFTTAYEGELTDTRSGQQPIEIILNRDVTARYIRVTGYVLRDKVGFGDGYLFSLYEFEVYNK